MQSQYPHTDKFERARIGSEEFLADPADALLVAITRKEPVLINNSTSCFVLTSGPLIAAIVPIEQFEHLLKTQHEQLAAASGPAPCPQCGGPRETRQAVTDTSISKTTCSQCNRLEFTTVIPGTA